MQGRTHVAIAVGASVALFAALVGIVSAAPAPRPLRAAPPAEHDDAGPRLALGLERPRYLQLVPALEVMVQNEGDEPVEVVHLALDPGSRFAPAGGRSASTDIAPGQRVDMRIGYGEIDCRDQPMRPPVVELEVRTAGGAPERVVAEPHGGDELLGLLHDRACAVAAAQEAVAVGFSDQWSRDGDAARGAITLDRAAGEGAFTFVEAAGTVIFSLDPVGDPGVPWLKLPADETEASLPVEVRAVRCDAHAVSDSKKSFQFRSWVRPSGADEDVFMEIVPGESGRALLQELIADCVEAGRG